MNPPSRPQSASLPKDGIKVLKKRGNSAKSASRKPLVTHQAVVIPIIPTASTLAPTAKEGTSHTKESEGTILPSSAWTSKRLQTRPKTAPSKTRGSSKKNVHKKLMPLPKKIDTLDPSQLVDTVTLKNKSDVDAIEEEEEANKFLVYRELLGVQERRARASYIQVTVLKYVDSSLVLEKLYPPTATILDVKADVQTSLAGSSKDIPEEYDRDESFYGNLVAIDQQVLRVGDFRVGGASRNSSMITAGNHDTLKQAWYLSPLGAKVKSVEQFKHAQKRVENMNMAARRKGGDQKVKEKRRTLEIIDTKKGRGSRIEDVKPDSPTSPATNSGWMEHEHNKEDAVEAKRKKLLFFSESWVLDDDHDHLLKFIAGASDKPLQLTSPTQSASDTSGFNLDVILGRSSITRGSMGGDVKESGHKDITTWQTSEWGRRLAEEWRAKQEELEEKSTQNAANVKPSDRINAQLKSQRHAKSLENRRKSMLTKDVASWDGVLVLDGRASKIHLAHLRPPLCGRIDKVPELGRLTALLRINLSDNQLKGKIPGQAIARLLHLSSLNLSNNQFTGRIPCNDLGHVHSLTDLRLSSNRLTGPLSHTLCRCSNLKTLELSGNSLTGELPEQLGSLHQLLVLNLSRNQFTGWLKKWIGMPTLQRLSLQHNYLRGGLESLGKLTSCEYLHLNDNRFDGEIDVSVFSSLYLGVREIHLQGNRFFDDDSDARFQAADRHDNDDSNDNDSYFSDGDSENDSVNSNRRARLLETKFELEEMFPDCSVLI